MRYAFNSVTPKYHSISHSEFSLRIPTLYYPQVGGMRYAFNSDNPVGHRLLAAASSPSGAPIDPCKMYNVVTTHYLADGGDGYNLIAEAHTLEANGAAQDQVIIGTVKARSPVRGGIQGIGWEARGQAGFVQGAVKPRGVGVGRRGARQPTIRALFPIKKYYWG